MKQNKDFSRPSGNPATTVVLHVEDDPNDVELLKAAARKAGGSVLLRNASDACEAMAYLESLCQAGPSPDCPMPTVILLDLNLPRATGHQFLNWIRAQPVLQDIPVVVLSGSDSLQDRHCAYAAGAASYEVKPLGMEPLVALVSRIGTQWAAPRAQA